MVRVKGLEPIRYNRQILSLVRLPIPPHPHGIIKGNALSAIRTRDTLIKSQVLCLLS